MIFKSFTIAFYVALVRAQFPPWDDGLASDNDYGIPIPERCNLTFCHHAPCEGAAPPATCPAKMPACPTGCACTMDCSTNVQTCFMTSHCSKIRRFFTKRRHARALSQNNPPSSETLNFNPETQAEIESSSITLTQDIMTHADLERETNNLTHTLISHKQTVDGFPSSTATVVDVEIPVTNPAYLNQSADNNHLPSISPSVLGRVERELPSKEREILTQSTSSDFPISVAQDTNESERDVASVTQVLVGRVERDLPESTESTGNAEHESVEILHSTDQGDDTGTEDNNNLENEVMTLPFVNSLNNQSEPRVLISEQKADTITKVLLKPTGAGMKMLPNDNVAFAIIFACFRPSFLF